LAINPKSQFAAQQVRVWNDDESCKRSNTDAVINLRTVSEAIPMTFIVVACWLGGPLLPVAPF